MRIFVGALYDLFVLPFVELLEGLVLEQFVHQRLFGLARMSFAIMIQR